MVDVQLASDALIVSGFIAVSGGITSYFAALYVLPIAAASSVQFRRGGMMIAMLSALLYVGIVLTQYFGLADLLGVPFLEHQGTLPPLRIVAYTAGLTSARRRTARARLQRDCRPAGIQPARHRQPVERPGDDRPAGTNPHVQSRG
jgi:hypothetical protein